MQLRPYQEEARKKVQEQWEGGVNKTLLVLPTGCGKTIVFSKIIEDRVKLIEPLEVIDFHNFLNKSYLILTDSGGIQEEAPSLGKPVLVLRDTTERPEGVAAGTLKLVGTKEEDIYNNFKLLLEDNEEYKKMSQASNPYGDGRASERIAEVLLKEI